MVQYLSCRHGWIIAQHKALHTPACFGNNALYNRTNCQGKHTNRNYPPWPGTIVPFAWDVSGQEVLVRNTELIIYYQPEAFRKDQKEMPRVLPSPRILLTGIHLDWATCRPPGRTLNQNDWPKTTQKPVPYHKTQDCKPWGRTVLGSFTLLLSIRAPLASKISCFVSTCVSLVMHYWVLDKSPLSGPGRVPPSCNNSGLVWAQSSYASGFKWTVKTFLKLVPL